MAGHMREVELVDEVDERQPAALAGERVDEAGTGPQRPAGSWFRAHARWLVPTVAVVALGLVATQGVLDQRERSRVAALALIPGVVPPAGPDIGVIWRAPPELATVMQGGAMVDGLMVGGAADELGNIRVVALDPDTGATRWSTPVTLPLTQPQVDGQVPGTWVSCREVPHHADPVAACISQQYGENIIGLPDSTVWVLDPTDGTVLSTRSIPGTSGVTVAQDALVLATRVDDDGAPARNDASSVRWKVTATDAVSDAPLWDYTTPPVDVLGREDGPAAANATGGAMLETFEGQVILTVDNYGWILDEDGTLVRSVPLEPGSWLQGARAGAFVKSSYSSDTRYAGTLLLAGGREVPMDQSAAWLPVDDGSAPDVVLTIGAGPTGELGISGRDATTGDVLWHRPDAVTAALLLDGVVYVAAFSEISALDARTGEEHWTTDLENQPQQLSTDGRYLLVPGTGVTLEAYSLADGRRAWAVDLEDAVTGGDPDQIAQGFQSSGRDPRLFVWMHDGAVAVLG